VLNLTTLFAGTLFILLVAVVIMGIVIFRNRSLFNKPGIGVSLSILLQLTVFVLFFTNTLAEIPLTVFNLLWWGAVLLGLVFGVLDFKENVIVSLVAFILSGLMSAVGFLIFLITST
jgi:hypothetical protein